MLVKILFLLFLFFIFIFILFFVYFYLFLVVDYFDVEKNIEKKTLFQKIYGSIGLRQKDKMSSQYIVKY